VVPSATYGRLVVLNGADKGSTFPLATTMNTIGLGEENQIVLTGNGIARQHAGITISDKQYELRDYGSETGTYVNGSRVTHRLLRDNDVVRIGDVEVVFEMARR
jgi:pSer/pThr/pTyr-binding forkhead associated (FHA) protein